MLSNTLAYCASVSISIRIRVLFVSLAAIAALQVAGFDLVSHAFAQTPAPVTLSGLFDDDLAELKTTVPLLDAIKKAHRDCYPPRIKFTVVVHQNGDDTSFPKALAGARMNALAATIPRLGVDAGPFKVEWALGRVENVQVSYDKFEGDDRESPKLMVTSTPKTGTKVKAGDQIKVTITASERYEDGHKSWPSGVQRIKLLADGGKIVESKDYGPGPPPCEPRTFEATYTVPSNPPPIVHLFTIAQDAVGNKPAEVAVEFPTSGDICHFWVGNASITLTGENGSVADPGHFVSKTTYHIRLREGAKSHPLSNVIPLINVGSLVEGSFDEEQSRKSGNHTSSGSGKASVLYPGQNANNPKVGFLRTNEKGERIDYRFEMGPDDDKLFFSTTVHNFMGDPPREEVSEDKTGGTFRPVSIGESSDPQEPRLITGAGLLMEGNYSIKVFNGGSETSWNLRSVIAPCVQPPPPDAAAPGQVSTRVRRLSRNWGFSTYFRLAKRASNSLRVPLLSPL